MRFVAVGGFDGGSDFCDFGGFYLCYFLGRLVLGLSRLSGMFCDL